MRYIILVLALLLSLQGCGHKGPLTLPKTQATGTTSNIPAK
jgi:predicted small lipoprotein YifL